MSKRLDTLRLAYERNPSLSSLIEYLEQAYQEQEHQVILDTITAWEGGTTPELDFYAGAALLGIGKREEAAAKFNAVLAINPHHFRAKKSLDEIGAESQKTSAGAPATRVTRQIRIHQIPVEETDHYRRAGWRTIALAILVAIVIVVIIAVFVGRKKSGAEELVRDPETTLWPRTYMVFEQQADALRSLERAFPAEDAPRKALFYLTAFVVLDYHLADHEELLTQVRFYYTLTVEKDPAMTHLLDYIEGHGALSSLTAGHQRVQRVVSNPTNTLEGDLPILVQEVCEKNLRRVWYDALFWYRIGRYDEAIKTLDAILAVFPETELAQKLRIVVVARKAYKEGHDTLPGPLISKEQVQQFAATLARWRADSEERWLLSEAYVALGQAAQDLSLEKEGFYLGCPGQMFCLDIVNRFLEKGYTEEAKRMALFIKEKKGTSRTGDDLLLVMQTSLRDEDYGNCYFSFKEIQQFFPDRLTEDVLRSGALCCEKQNYLEEALELYEKTSGSSKQPESEAKIAEMRYLLRRDAQSAHTLKTLAERYPDTPAVLNSYLTVLLKGNNPAETAAVLERLYALTPPENRAAVIDRYLQAGLVARAVTLLTENRDRREMRERLYDLYNRYFLFANADAVAGKEVYGSTALWQKIRAAYDQTHNDAADAAVEALEKLESETEQKCLPPLLYLKAEAFRRSGNTAKTFAMIDALLECDRTYLPGLLFAAEMAYYQGDVQRAITGVKYLLEREQFLSPGRMIYHNYLTLFLAEMYIVKGREKQALDLLARSLERSLPWGAREREKLQDVYDKSKLVLKKRIEQIIVDRFGT